MRPAGVVLFRSIGSIDANRVDEKVNMVQAVRSHWPVSVVRKKEDLDEQVSTNLVNKYLHLKVENGPGTRYPSIYCNGRSRMQDPGAGCVKQIRMPASVPHLLRPRP